jgi:hypothetical protein
VNPGATEICDDLIDNDCDGDVDQYDSECTVIQSRSCQFFTWVPNFSGSGSAVELARMGMNMSTNAVMADVKDASSGLLLGNVSFTADYVPISIAFTPASFTGSGARELVVIQRRESDGATCADVRDASTGVFFRRLWYHWQYPPKDMETMDSFGGTTAPDVAVLSRRPSDGATAGAVRDASTGNLLNRLYFHSSFMPVDLEVVPNFGGTSADELVSLGQHVDDDRIAGGVRDASSDVLLKRVFFDEPGRDHPPLDIEVLANFGDTSAPELVMMGQRGSDNDIIAEVRDASTGTLLSTVSFDDTYAALDLEVVPNFGGTAAPELVMLGYRESDDSKIGEVRDASSGALLQTVTFEYSPDYVPKGIEVLPNFSGSAARELAVHSVRTSDGAVRGEVRDASSGAWLKNVTFNADYEIP